MRYLLTILLLLSLTARAQVNLVRNPSFEEYSVCPELPDGINLANYWSGIDSFGNDYCTPEYRNVCASLSIASIPYNGWFYQYPRTGNGMAQVQMFYDEISPSPYKRDYLLGRLKNALSDGQQYCITFYVNLGEMSNHAINRIGAYLDDGSICNVDSCGLPHTQYTPQVQAVNIISDTLNWVKIEGIFTANGTEKFITIGNFYDFINTSHIPWDIGSAIHYTWYHVDDVSVFPSDLQAYAGPDTTFILQVPDSLFMGRDEVGLDCEWYLNGNLIDSSSGVWWYPTGVGADTYVVKQTLCGVVTWDTAIVALVANVPHLNTHNIQLKLSPNPVSTQLTITANTDIKQVTITDITGREVLRSSDTTIDVSGLVSGVYFVRVRDVSGGSRVEKILKQ